MFSFFKKSKPVIDFGILNTDMHSHLLPGIDDGSPDAATSIRLIKGMMELGYKKFIATPHVMLDLHKNTPATISAAHEVLKNELIKEGMNVEVHAAAEYLIDEQFEEMVTNKAPLLTLKDNFVLVEFSFINAPIRINEVIFELQMNGYQPVLAHPERYSYMLSNKSLFDSLKQAGCLFQLNILALTNYYGKGVTQLAEYLLSKDYYDLVGTDLHHGRHLATLQDYGSAYNTILRLNDRGRLLNSTW